MVGSLINLDKLLKLWYNIGVLCVKMKTVNLRSVIVPVLVVMKVSVYVIVT